MDLNRWVGIGKLESAPVLTNNNGVSQVSVVVLVNRRVPNANGQWVDQISKVPCYAQDKKADAIAQNCVAGQEVTVEAYYQSWTDANGNLAHVFVIQNISFGFKPRPAGQGGFNQNMQAM